MIVICEGKTIEKFYSECRKEFLDDCDMDEYSFNTYVEEIFNTIAINDRTETANIFFRETISAFDETVSRLKKLLISIGIPHIGAPHRISILNDVRDVKIFFS